MLTIAKTEAQSNQGIFDKSLPHQNFIEGLIVFIPFFLAEMYGF